MTADHESSSPPFVLDARFALYGRGMTDAESESTPATAPYPGRYVERVTLKDGTPALIRPIHPTDEPLMVRFHRELGEDSVFLRYAGALKLEQRIDHHRLARRCRIDFENELALVVECLDQEGEPRILGIGRLIKLSERVAEFGLVVVDRAQGKAIGSQLLDRLIRFARDQNLERLQADILVYNRPMQRVAEKLGFEIIHPEDMTDTLVRAELLLTR